MYFCDRWNKHVEWLTCQRIISEIPAIGYKHLYIENNRTDPSGNRKWEINNIKDLESLVNEILKSPINSLITLPFDQQLGKYHSLFSSTIFKENIANIFSPLLASKPNTKVPYVAVHIRRGDCTPERFPEWYIEDSQYIRLFHTLSSILPSSMPIQICTQGDTSWIQNWIHSSNLKDRKVYINSSESNFTNDQEIDHFVIMANASILITCGSSFGHWAGIIGKAEKIVDFSRIKSPLNTATRINPDQKIDNFENLIEKLVMSS